MKSSLILPILLGGTTAFASELESKPLLRIEAGQHTESIHAVASDASGRLVVTASFDKTARIWDAESGEQLGVLRPFVGPCAEGMLTSAAMTPDGLTVALGGITTRSPCEISSVFLFDTPSGTLLRRIPDLPQVVLALAFSPDGARLAVGLTTGGVRVYRTADASEVGRDAAYSGPVTDVGFDRSGRLVAVSYDGIRLYDASLHLLNKAPGAGGMPLAARFSPDGQQLAVGYSKFSAVDLLSAKDLTPVLRVSPPGGGGDFSLVDWSADGQTLYASQTLASGGSRVRHWSAAGHGPATDTPVSSRFAVQGLRPAGGGVAFVTDDPAWGIVNQAGRVTVSVGPSQATFPKDPSHLRVSSDGTRVQFDWGVAGRPPSVFDLRSRTLRQVKKQDATLIASSSSMKGVAVDLTNPSRPVVNGVAIPGWVPPMNAAAISPDGGHFVLGGLGGVAAYNSSTRARVWIAPSIRTVLSVALTADDRFAVTAESDGTIRWYSTGDGRPLLALFPHLDGKRWVVWTPDGEYDASPGGENLIGWHVNNGLDAAADFYPASRFRDQFYRPKAVQQAIPPATPATSDTVAPLVAEATPKPSVPAATGVLKRAVAAQQAVTATAAPTDAALVPLLPPLVRILSPASGQTIRAPSITLRAMIRTRSNEPIRSVEVLIDGRRLSEGVILTAMHQRKGEALVTLSVPVPAHDSSVSVVAHTVSTTSEPTAIRLYWNGQSAKRPTAVAAPATLRVLAIGIGAYADPTLRLGSAARDAGDFAAAFGRQRGLQFGSVETRVLADGQATRSAILDGLSWLRRSARTGDESIVYLAGQGVSDDAETRFRLLPVDARADTSDDQTVRDEDLADSLGRVSGSVLLFLDACHQCVAAHCNPLSLVNRLSSDETGVVVYSASSARALVPDPASGGRGAFAQAVLEGFAGKAAGPTGNVTLHSLDDWISTRVAELTDGSQNVASGIPAALPDLAVAAVR